MSEYLEDHTVDPIEVDDELWPQPLGGVCLKDLISAVEGSLHGVRGRQQNDALEAAYVDGGPEVTFECTVPGCSVSYNALAVDGIFTVMNGNNSPKVCVSASPPSDLLLEA